MPRGAPFPRDIAEFDADDRISYSTLDGKYILIDDDNEEWEFSEATGSWFQPATDEQIAAYQQAYGGGPEAEEAENDESSSAARPKKRKASASNADASEKKPRVQENRAIYITNLPLDATVEEIDIEFSKYGMIDQGVRGEKRIKMYTDEEGNFKGEALVVYFKKDSVDMAIKMMDDSWFRPGVQGPNIRVKEADMTHKRVKNVDDVGAKLTRKDRKTHGQNRAEMNRRLAEWSDDEDEVAKETLAPTNKWAKIVIVKYAFTLDELEKDPNATMEIAEDMREEGEEFGKVTNVVVYDREPDGIVTVRFEDAEAAAKFIEKCNGRFFDNRKLVVTAAQDNPKGKFKKSDRYVDEEEQDKHLESLITE